jgi:hypothetical protein
VKGRPAIVIVAERDGPVVAATVNCTSPLPLPLVPEVIVIHDAPLDALQAHPALVETATFPLPPDDAIDWLSGEIE